jgi:tripartite-type tricarboxylate transporter receptor subunit TctC
MKLRRRQFLQLAGAAIAAPASSPVAWAQAYPVRPVRLLVGFAPGGVTDIMARLIGQWLSERLGQQFFVENRTGAATNVATEAVVRAAPDGYTLLVSSAANAINATLYDNLNFNFIRDTVPIASIISTPLVMVVNPSFSARTVPAFIAYAKDNPGGINMASSGSGSPPHVAGELFKMMAGIKMTYVPYRGDVPAITDLLAGQVQVYFGTLPASIEYIKAGNLRALAVTSATRLRALPDIPTMGEFLPGYEATIWNGLNAPRNTSDEIVEKLNRDINAALADPKHKARICRVGSSAACGFTLRLREARRRRDREMGQGGQIVRRNARLIQRR